MAQTDINQLEDLPFVEPSNKVVKKAENLYNILNASLPNTERYKKAADEVEILVASEYGLSESLRKDAIRTVESKNLASISSIQKVIEKSRRKRKQVKRKRGRIN